MHACGRLILLSLCVFFCMLSWLFLYHLSRFLQYNIIGILHFVCCFLFLSTEKERKNFKWPIAKCSNTSGFGINWSFLRFVWERQNLQNRKIYSNDDSMQTLTSPKRWFSIDLKVGQWLIWKYFCKRKMFLPGEVQFWLF